MQEFKIRCQTGLYWSSSALYWLLSASLTGYAYELKIEDALQIPLPGEIAGKVRLTVPYDGIMSSFLTIPITLKIAGEYMSKRIKVM